MAVRIAGCEVDLFRAMQLPGIYVRGAKKVVPEEGIEPPTKGL